MAVGRLLSNQTNYKFTSFSPHKIPYFSNILYIFTRESLAGTWSPKTQAQAVGEEGMRPCQRHERRRNEH